METMTKIKLSAWVSQQIADFGIRHVFMLTGGGAMHLNHSFGTDPRLSCVFTHHEQALAMAAEAYYRLTNRLAVVNVTSGPGGTNAITGVYGAYVDSIGMLIISGQVKIETTVRSTGLALRQYGDQELDIEELGDPLSSRKGTLHRHYGTARAGLARYPPRRPGGADRPRRPATRLRPRRT